MSGKSIYLINPASDFLRCRSGEVCACEGVRPTIALANLPVATVAAMVPDDFEISICEEAVSPVDFDTPAAIVGITSTLSQRTRVKTLAAEFRRRGKTVVIGGPQASLAPQTFRSCCDVLVRGEIEDIAAELFADLAAGTCRDEYVGNRPDLSRSPAPRWDLYPLDRALLGMVQSSRGCPFSCEFCDVGPYLGHEVRRKPHAQVVSELDALYRRGVHRVFFGDDNFTGNRSHVKELLESLINWNARQTEGRFSFTAQMSIDTAKDESLLQMLSDAGCDFVYIGLETSNAESLRETKKYQNLNVDLAEQVLRFVRHRIAVAAALVVGFDSDGPDIFERLYDFGMSTAIPLLPVNVLYAPEGTPLHDRMARENRLVREGDFESRLGSSWNTNLIPLQMTRKQLLDGAAALSSRLYHPAAFGQRLMKLIEEWGPRGTQSRVKSNVATSKGRKVERDYRLLPGRLRSLGPLEEQLFDRTLAAITKKPEAGGIGLYMLGQYVQARMGLDRHLLTPDS